MHDGGLQNATERMRNGIWEAGQKAGRKIVYYLDSGNPTSPQRVFNPYQHGIPAYNDAMEIQQESLLKLATKPEELVWAWATKWGRDSVVADPHDVRGRLVDDKGPHMFKSWFDRQDSWQSVLTNAANQVRVAEYQLRAGWCAHSDHHATHLLWFSTPGAGRGSHIARLCTSLQITSTLPGGGPEATAAAARAPCLAAARVCKTHRAQVSWILPP